MPAKTKKAKRSRKRKKFNWKNPVWTIAQAIEREAGIHKGYLNLETKINEVVGAKVIDRRKLKDLVDGERVTISTDELIAMDRYFSPMGEGFGLKPLFHHYSFVQDMAENSRIQFILGAFYRNKEERNDVSLWDVKAQQEIVRGIHLYRETAQVTIVDVPFFDQGGKHNTTDAKNIKNLLDTPNCSTCVIGSTRANVAAEIVLGELFGVQPFKESQRSVPFRFYWPADKERKDANFASAFQLTEKDLEALDPEKRKMIKDPLCDYALVVGEQIYKVSPRAITTRGGVDYGIVAGQRQSTGRVRVVVAGLTGPSSLAAARAACTKITASLPPPRRNGDQITMWAIVKATIGERKPRIGDIRSVESVHIVGDPRTVTLPKKGRKKAKPKTKSARS